jgi:hypothetical protein
LLLLLNPWTSDLLASLVDISGGGGVICTGKGLVGNATIGKDNVGWFAIIGVVPDDAVII